MNAVSKAHSGRIRYTDEEKSRLREVPMVEVLRDLGYDTSHTSSGLFFSPFSQGEKTPSFHIDQERLFWKDFSASAPDGKSGGDVFDLVVALRRCSFPDALDYLAKLSPNIIIQDRQERLIGTPSESGAPKVVVTKVQTPIYSHVLRDYAENTRGIPRFILDKYCSQVNYKMSYSTGESADLYAIGFRNVKGNWALRNLMKTRNKISSGQAISVVLSDGTQVQGDSYESRAGNVAVFEGFFNFLSWLAWTNTQVPLKGDAIILNTVTNASHIFPFIEKYNKVVLYLDNDRAGDKTTKLILDKCGQIGVRGVDGRGAYKGFNDLNDAWMDKVAKTREQSESRRLDVPQVKTTEWVAKPKMH